MTLPVRFGVAAAALALFLLPGCPGPDPTPPATCGDAKIQKGEACDDGNQTPGDGCENDCTLTQNNGAVCGNGVKEGAEQCDDGNQTPADGCENDCTFTHDVQPVCGNGVKEANEACDDGNQTAGDGCENDCTETVSTVEMCPNTIAPPSSGTCDVTPGDANRLISGTVLAPGKILVNGQVLYDAQGQITCVACDCSGAAGAATATKIACADGIVSPGLINSHDHITYQAEPFVPTTDERFEHRNDWREGQDGHQKISNGGASSNGSPQVEWGELRQVMAGGRNHGRSSNRQDRM